jgi:hypothetical protein
MSAVGCEDFFTYLCSALVSIHPAIVKVIAHLGCSIKSQLLVIEEMEKK